MSVNSQNNIRVIVGAIIAPTVPIILLSLVGLLFNVSFGYGVIGVSLTLAYLAAFLLGWPAYLLSKRLELSKLFHFLLLGLVCGALIGTAFLAFISIGNEYAIQVAINNLGYVVFIEIYSLIVSLSFWAIAVKKRDVGAE